MRATTAGGPATRVLAMVLSCEPAPAPAETWHLYTPKTMFKNQMRRKSLLCMHYLLLQLLLLWMPAPAHAQWTVPRRPKGKTIVVKKEAIYKPDPHLPDEVKRRYLGKMVSGSYKICIGTNADPSPHFQG
jgi:hypothetical protein